MNTNTNTSLRNRGFFGWVVAVAIIAFYVLLYYDDRMDASWYNKGVAHLRDDKAALTANLKKAWAELKEKKATTQSPKASAQPQNQNQNQTAAKAPSDGYTQAGTIEALESEVGVLKKEIGLLDKQLRQIKRSLIQHPPGEYATKLWGKDVELTPENKELVDKLRAENIITQRYLYLLHSNDVVNNLSYLVRNQPADKWFLYGLLYTLLILVFGVKFIRTWKDNKYQKWRTLSVMSVQLWLAFVLPGVLKRVTDHEFYLSYFWPLKIEYLYPDKLSDLPLYLGLWALMMAFIAVPILTYYYGKRWYCSWVCGCGALANTFGDQWRHLSDKSRRAWRIEKVTVHTVLGIAVISTGAVLINAFRGPVGDGFNTFVQGAKNYYFLFITAGFAGVVGTGFYPIMGTRVWCRFGCPQAAILGILQVFFSRFRITVNGDQCMSCGNCSTYCEMGIDVRAYAMRGQDFARASCVGCGLCSTTCPRGVLKLETKRDGRTSVRAEF